jgi:magnesium transporter
MNKTFTNNKPFVEKLCTTNKTPIEKYLITKVPIVKKTDKVIDILNELEKSIIKYEIVNYIYVKNDDENLIGVFSIKELFNNHKKTKVENFMKTKVISVKPTEEFEKIAHLALKHNLKQVPVTISKKLIGVVSSKQIIHTINISLKKDIFRFAGIHKSHLEFENSLEIPLKKALQIRLPWLLIGLIGAILMAVFISFFEETLAKNIIIASFVPAIVYISGASVNQFQTVFVRDLAILGKEINLKKYFLKQLKIAFLTALLIGTILFLFINSVWQTQNTALIIALAASTTLLITGFNSLIITLLIKKLKFDPALGSGPIATIISDFSSIVIYFTIIVILI